MQHLLEQLKRHRLVPVVALNSVADAVPLSDALAAGGLPMIEITFRTAAAEDAIRAVARAGRVMVGAGTVLNIEGARRAIDAGAAFVVSPGFSAKLVEFCLDKKMPIIPGAAHASDLQVAVGEFGLSLVKFFPAEASGGIAAIKALSGPFFSVRFMPTGGITRANLKAYLDCGPVVACGGTWMATPDLIAGQRFDEVRTLTAESVALVQSAPARL